MSDRTTLVLSIFLIVPCPAILTHCQGKSRVFAGVAALMSETMCKRSSDVDMINGLFFSIVQYRYVG